MSGLGWQWTWTLKPLKHGGKVEVRGYVNTKKALWAGLRLSGVMRLSPPEAHNLWTLTLRCISNVLACVRRTYPHSWGGERIQGKTDCRLPRILNVIIVTDLVQYHVQWVYDLFEKVRWKLEERGSEEQTSAACKWRWKHFTPVFHSLVYCSRLWISFLWTWCIIKVMV